MQHQISNNLLIAIPTIVPPIILGGLGVIAIVVFFYSIYQSHIQAYIFQRFPNISGHVTLLEKLTQIFSLKKIALALEMYYLVYATYLTVSQYYIWNSNEFTRLFLHEPLSPDVPIVFFFKPFAFLFKTEAGYFIHYALGRFWLPVIITLLSAFVLYGVLKIVERFRQGTFTQQELTFFLIGALIVGWPDILVFTVLTLVFAIIHAVINTLRGVTETPISLALVIALITTFFWGTWLIDILNLTVLKL